MEEQRASAQAGRRETDGFGGVAHAPPADELSLADLVRALGRRWYVIAAVTLLTTGLAVAYALLQPDTWRYEATLRVGQMPDTEENNDRMVAPLEAPGETVTQMQAAWIPSAVRAALAELPEEQRPSNAEVTVESPEGARTVILSGEAPEKHAAVYTGAMERAMRSVLASHRQPFQAERSRYDARLQRAEVALDKVQNETLFENELATQRDRIEAARDKLSDLQDQREVLLSERDSRLTAQRNRIAAAERKRAGLQSTREVLGFRRGNLDERRALLEAQAQRLEGFVERTNRQQVAAADTSTDAGSAMSLMLLGNQVQQLRTRLDEIERRLSVELPEQRRTLTNELAGNARQQAAARQEKAQLEQELRQLRASFEEKLAANERARNSQQREIARLERELETMRIERRQAIENAKQDVREAEARLASVVPTRILSEPVRSLEPVGIPGSVIAVLGLILGLGAGTVLALLVDAVADGSRTARDRRPGLVEHDAEDSPSRLRQAG